MGLASLVAGAFHVCWPNPNQELMREQRGALEDQGQAAAAAAAGGRGVTMLDSPAYSSMLPEEQAAT